MCFARFSFTYDVCDLDINNLKKRISSIAIESYIALANNKGLTPVAYAKMYIFCIKAHRGKIREQKI